MTTPSHIGQYRILRKIGAGGMGLVFLGEHTLLRRRAAIKTLLPTVAANREIVERFFNEARATSAISDPGVIQVFDFGYHVDGTAYIVMELLEGEALSARLERLGALPLGEALRIARQVTGSLSAAHARNIVHRDLKPENIFLVGDAEAQGGERTKILDFGICKFSPDGDPGLTQSGAMVGTPVYMSPEQCRGADDVDHRSDIYALGCLVFHMLTGRPPFLGDAAGDLVVAHLQEVPPLVSQYVPNLPPAVDAVVLRCLEKAPEDRFQSMSELQAVLGELYAQLDGTEVAVDPVRSAVALGPGFRSQYDANMASRLGADSPLIRTRIPWLQPVTTSSTTSRDLDVVRPNRSGLSALLACVLVAGVVVGLTMTSYMIYSADRREEAEEAEAKRQSAPVAAAPVAPSREPRPAIEAAARTQLAASTTRSAGTTAFREPASVNRAAPAGDDASAGDAAVAAGDRVAASGDGGAPVVPVVDRPAPAAERERTSPAAAQRHEPTPAATTARRSSSLAAAGPVRSPRDTVTAAPAPAAAAPTASTSPASAPPASPAPPTEDLYDTR